jgi:PTS system mannose-specific IIA component
MTLTCWTLHDALRSNHMVLAYLPCRYVRRCCLGTLCASILNDNIVHIGANKGIARHRSTQSFRMIGLVLVTHGRLAEEFRAALEHVVGTLEQIEVITIGAEDDPELCRSDIIEAVKRVDSGDGVVILTDMFGGTPSNLAISCMSRPKVDVLAGVNLPILVKLAKVREEHSLPEALAMAQEAGRKYVTVASRVLAGE